MSTPVTLYTYSPFLNTLRTVYRLDDDPTTINYSDFSPAFGPDQPPEDTVISIICQPGTFDEYTYRVKSNPPYAYFTKIANSSHCGYTPPTCDISQSSFFKTDETNTGANDGTANLFCISTYAPITYYLIHVILPSEVIIATNTTGYFTNIPPGDYRILAQDTNSCQLSKSFTIIAFSTDYTHYKYRLQFPNKDNSMTWELQLYDMKNAYLKTQYPKDVEGGADPVIWTRQDQNEDKFSPIITHQLAISLLYDSTLFTVEEFALVPEQTWYVQLVSGGVTYFKGYLLPDEMQDEYSDPPYNVKLTATDGLPSLKGNKWGNGSGGQGYGTLQIQQYGLTLWANLLKQCLDQLRYDYGAVHIMSSLQYNSNWSTGLWLNISTWSDILYDGSGVPLSTYDALSLLLTGMKLSIIQEKGEFRLINWNDISYINNGVVSRQYSEAFYQILPGFTGIITEDPNIDYQIIGFDAPLSPCNPPQTWHFDKPYNIENDCSFNLLALLYENPSFEIGAVQGQMPPGWTGYSSGHQSYFFAYCNYDPLDPTNPNAGAADGNWELRTDWLYINSLSQLLSNFMRIQYPFPVDEANRFVNVSFVWRPIEVPGLPGVNTLPQFSLIFQDGGSGNQYCYTATANPPHWFIFTSGVGPSELNMINPNVSTNGDYTSWQNYSLQTAPLPESGRGSLWIEFHPPAFYANTTIAAGTRLIADIDLLNITLGNTQPQTISQIGEKHITTIVTGLPPADVKQNDFKLFTFPSNKRVAGNVFYGTDYSTGVIANKWNFALKSLDPPDRLPATITKAYARQYKRSFYKWEGSVEAAYMPYYGVYGLRFYEGKLFMPFKIESHLRDNINSIVLIEFDDSEAQDIYTYVPLYQRNSRSQ